MASRTGDQDPVERGVSVEPEKRGPTIIVVDDEAAMCAVVADILSAAGYTPVVTSDSRTAFELVRREKPALVLADISMPFIDGYAVIDALRADPETRACPVMFLTGHLSFSDRQQAFRRGARDYVTKPIVPSKLLAKIARILSGPSANP
jgi:putative two-component system response regulator